MSTLDEDERKFIEELIAQSGFSLRELSIKIGRKESYLHQYVKYGHPIKLDQKDKEEIIKMARGRFRKSNFTAKDAFWESVGYEYLSGSMGGGYFNSRRFDDILEERLSLEVKGLRKEPENPLVDVIIHSADVVEVKREIGYMMLRANDLANVLNYKKYPYWGLKVVTSKMSPTIERDDIVVYDSDIKKFIGEGVYIVIEDDLYVPKRVVVDNKGVLRLKDDCDRRRSTKISSDFEFCGRVVSVLNVKCGYI